MALEIRMAFTDPRLGAFIPQSDLGELSIDRLDGLAHGKDLYLYRAKLVMAEGFGHDDNKTVVVTFKHKYSHGILSLLSMATRVLIKTYPWLKAGRYGVPRNRLKCRKCGTVIWSQFRHDFTSCKCGAISVDGGYDYSSRTGNPKLMEAVLEPWQESNLRKGKKSRAANVASASPRKQKATAPTRTRVTKPSTKTAKSTPTSPCFSANVALRSGTSGIPKRTKR